MSFGVFFIAYDSCVFWCKDYITGVSIGYWRLALLSICQPGSEKMSSCHKKKIKWWMESTH